MSQHKTGVHLEIAFEDDICAHLAARGWRYTPGDVQHYDRARALFPTSGSHAPAWEQVATLWRRVSSDLSMSRLT